MKRIYTYITILTLALFSVSCSLEENVYTQTDEDFITNAELSETLIMGVYKKLGTDGIYRQNLPFIFSLTTDESKPEGSSLTSIELKEAMLSMHHLLMLSRHGGISIAQFTMRTTL